MNGEGVCRTAPATPGLLNTVGWPLQIDKICRAGSLWVDITVALTQV